MQQQSTGTSALTVESYMHSLNAVVTLIGMRFDYKVFGVTPPRRRMNARRLVCQDMAQTQNNTAHSVRFLTEGTMFVSIPKFHIAKDAGPDILL